MSSADEEDDEPTEDELPPRPERRAARNAAGRKTRKRQRSGLRKPGPAPLRAKPRSERAVRGFVIAGAAVALVGIAVVGTRDSSLGAALVIGGLVTLIASIHTLGRLGPDEGVPSR